MRKALHLAERGWGQVHPNPLVGALVCRDGRVIGQGWHARFGAPHAERVALDEAGDAARGATLYVTLEPCAHTGKQPPCVEAIIAAGVARVVIAMRDPNPEAAGGIERLRATGIEVVEDVEGEAARRLNVRFTQRFSPQARPFVAVKLAVTMDGCIADHAGRSRWISGDAARDWVHRERAQHAAIGIGAVSAIRDDARLTVRGAVVPREPPARVVFDRGGRLPGAHGIFADASDVPVIVVRGPAAPTWQPPAGVTAVVAATAAEAMASLRDLGLESIMVEGGGRLAGELMRDGLVDRVNQIQSPLWLGAGIRAWQGLGAPDLADAVRWRTVLRRRLGDDTLLVLEP